VIWEDFMTPKIAFALVVGLGLSGCARHVVLDPEIAAARNAKEWTVKREPGRPAAVAPASAPPAQAAPVPSPSAPPAR
jgi:hypothetical protein